ncbi:MAG: RNA 3'-terminal phosphate cyclase [bacterium]|nr:RNA 3'-terminal phosphate cyclase [bacterium]
MMEIDGSFGEGGGQIVRSSLSLSMITGKAIHIRNIRGGRKKPGLLRQHLTALEAAIEISSARAHGAELGSGEFFFYPEKIKPGNYHFSIGTAGSATLVFQTILLPLLLAETPSTITLEGGTHNPFAPPFDFLLKSFAPVIEKMGAKIKLSLERYGFYPAGGGKLVVNISPSGGLNPVEITNRGDITGIFGKALVSHIPLSVAQREVKTIGEKMNIPEENLFADSISNSIGPGNVVFVEVATDDLTELFTAFGEKGVRAEKVAARAVNEAGTYIDSGVPVGEHLADQLIMPMALAGGGAFTTLPLSMHTKTNIEVVKMFLDVTIETETLENGTCLVKVSS